MKTVLEDIQNGNFANRFVKDNENGFKEFYQLREQQHGHEIEAVGRELRKMMPFIKAKSIQNNKEMLKMESHIQILIQH